MSEMVERVAQAICGDDNPQNILEIHRIRDRLAIEAMREPTAAMLKAKGTEDTGGRGTVDEFLDFWSADQVWGAMISEALR